MQSDRDTQQIWADDNYYIFLYFIANNTLFIYIVANIPQESGRQPICSIIYFLL